MLSISASRGRFVGREELPRFEPPEPGRYTKGTRWQPLHHHVLANRLIEAVQRRNIEVRRETWAVSANGHVLYGGLDLEIPPEVQQRLLLPDLKSDGMGYSIGVRNSNDSRFAVTLSVGARVFICENGVITGSFVLRRRHTTGLDLDVALNEAMDRWLASARGIAGTVTRLRATRLSYEQAHDVLANLYREGAITATHLGKALDELHEPRFEEFRGNGDTTAWNVLNAVTFVAKTVAPRRQFQAITGATRKLAELGATV